MPNRDPVTGRFAVDEGDRLRAVLEVTADLTPLLKQAGMFMVAKSQEAFKRQGRSEPWRGRAVPNVAGIVADLAKGPSVKSRRFEERPAAIDTGALRQSITYKIVGKDSVEFGSNLPYAKLIQEGGTSEQPITEEVRKNLADFLKGRNEPELRKRLGFLFQADTLVTKVPARPFIEVTDQDRIDLERLAAAFVAKKAAAP